MSRITTSLLGLLMSIACFSQGKQDKSSDLYKIGQKYQAINQYKNYDVIIIEGPQDFLDHPIDGGGNLRGYYKGDTLVKIVEWYSLPNNMIQNEYYLDRKALFFVYATEEKYPYIDSLQTLDYSTTVVTFTGRYYFKNNKLIDNTLSKKKTGQSPNKDAAGFLQNVKRYTVLLNKQRN